MRFRTFLSGRSRIARNLLSAVLAAVAVSAGVLIARATGSSRLAAAFGGLVLAFGAGFWNYAVLAEVYSLAAALLLLVVYWLVRWRQTRRDGHLFAAAFCFALALGNHLSIVAIAPAIALLLLATDWRRVLRVRTLLPAAAIVAGGFLQYLYIIHRTRYGSSYREASATNLPELGNVIRATHFQEHIFTIGWNELLTTRLPEAGRLLLAEAGGLGLGLAVLGLLVLFRRDWRTAALVTLAFVSLCAFVLNLGGDLRGFLVVPLALIMPMVAAGADAFRAAATRLAGARAGIAVAIALLIYPATMVRANYAANDWRHRTADALFFRTLFRQLPFRAALLSEDYIADSVVTYMQAAEAGDRTRTLVLAAGDPDAVRRLFATGVPIFALDARHSELAPRGFHFERLDLFRPAQLARLFADEIPRRSAYRLIGPLPTVWFGDAAWHDITPAVQDGSVSLLIDNRGPFDARVILYAAGPAPIRPMLLGYHRYGRGEPSFAARQFDLSIERHRTALGNAMASDKVTDAALTAADRHVTRIEQVVNDTGHYAAWAVSFRAMPRRVLAFGRPDHPHERRAVASAYRPIAFSRNGEPRRSRSETRAIHGLAQVAFGRAALRGRVPLDRRP